MKFFHFIFLFLFIIFFSKLNSLTLYKNWDFYFRISGSYTKINVDNDNTNPSFTGIYNNDDLSSWLIGSKFVVEKFINKKNYWRNTLSTKFGKTNNKINTDEFDFESLYKFRFKRIDAYLSGEIYTIMNKFCEPNIIKSAAGASKSFIENNLTSFSSRFGCYYKKRFNPESNGQSGIELITEFQKRIYTFNKFESKAELYSEFDDIEHLFFKWDNIFFSKISDAFGIEFNWLLYYESKPKKFLPYIKYNEFSDKQTISISIVYELK